MRAARQSYAIRLPGWPQLHVLFFRSAKSKGPHLAWQLKVGLKVPDSTTGKADIFGQAWVVNFYSKIITRQKIARRVKDAILALVGHEIEESLRIDGARAFPDPHRKKPRKRCPPTRSKARRSSRASSRSTRSSATTG